MWLNRSNRSIRFGFHNLDVAHHGIVNYYQISIVNNLVCRHPLTKSDPVAKLEKNIWGTLLLIKEKILDRHWKNMQKSMLWNKNKNVEYDKTINKIKLRRRKKEYKNKEKSETKIFLHLRGLRNNFRLHIYTQLLTHLI